MDYTGQKLATFILLIWIVGTTANVGDYIVDIVNHLATEDTAVPKIVFLGLSREVSFDDDNLGRIIRDLRLECVSRLIVTCSSNVEQMDHLPKKPTLVLLQGNVRFCVDVFRIALLAFSSSTKVLLLVEAIEQEYYLYKILHELKFYNVVGIRADIYSNEIGHFREPEQVFQSKQIRNLQGGLITVIERPKYKCNQFRMALITQTALLINGSVMLLKHACQDSGTTCYEEFMLKKNIDFDCTIYSMRVSEQFHFETLASAMTSSEVILVPRGPFKILQLFIMPFSWKVWTTLLIIFISLEIIHIALPALFKNDPLLFIVCGFERYDLHKSTRQEKFILLSAVVLMFFITNAYSTILISLMISRPTDHPIRTLQQLVDSGVKIKSNPQTYQYLTEHPILGNSIVKSNESVFNMDMVHAHVVVRETAELVLPMYYDREHRMFRYSTLDQTLSMVTYMFRLSKRSGLLEAFQFVLDGMIESGLKDLLSQIRQNSRSAIDEEVDEMLNFTDLSSAWLALLCGLGTGTMMFFSELLWYKVMRSPLRIS